MNNSIASMSEEENEEEQQQHCLVSLGYNCDPRIHMAHNLNITRDAGYRSCPFDLCITPFQGLCECIETDFAYFFHELMLTPGPNADGDRSQCGNGGLNIINRYGMIFNHESPTHSHMFCGGKNDDLFYIRNNFEEFKKRYQQRIDNYQRYLRTCRRITFLYKPPPTGEWDMDVLEPLLREKYRDQDTQIEFARID